MTGKAPLYFQHILMFAFTKIERSDLTYPFRLFYDKLMTGEHNMDWCAKSYPLALTAYIPDHALRTLVEENCEKHVLRMSSEDIETVETWDLHHYYKNNKDWVDDIDHGIELVIFEYEKEALMHKMQDLEDMKSQIEIKLGEKRDRVYQLTKEIQEERVRSNKLAQDAQEKITKLEESLRYRIGEVFAQSASSPSEATRLPRRLYKLYRERKENTKKQK